MFTINTVIKSPKTLIKNEYTFPIAGCSKEVLVEKRLPQ
jgi:hypothetical protein